MAESHNEYVARLERLRDLRPGERVVVPGSGRTGVLVKRSKSKNNGWLVRWDVPVFGVTEGYVRVANLDRVKEES